MQHTATNPSDNPFPQYAQSPQWPQKMVPKLSWSRTASGSLSTTEAYPRLDIQYVHALCQCTSFNMLRPIITNVTPPHKVPNTLYLILCSLYWVQTIQLVHRHV